MPDRSHTTNKQTNPMPNISYLFHVWGGVGVGLVISICTVMFSEGNWNNLQLNNCFWNIWVALKRAWQVKDPP